MKAFSLYHQIKSHGLDVQILEGNLHVQPKHKITHIIRQQIREMKNELIDIIDDFEERAAIMEFHAGMTRQEAEAAAYNEIMKGN